jgi:hypothetical protein
MQSKKEGILRIVILVTAPKRGRRILLRSGGLFQSRSFTRQGIRRRRRKVLRLMFQVIRRWQGLPRLRHPRLTAARQPEEQGNIAKPKSVAVCLHDLRLSKKMTFTFSQSTESYQPLECFLKKTEEN